MILAIAHLVSDSQSLVSIKPFTGDSGFAALAAGAAVAAYSFLGFDAISTLTEETHDAERNDSAGHRPGGVDRRRASSSS